MKEESDKLQGQCWDQRTVSLSVWWANEATTNAKEGNGKNSINKVSWVMQEVSS